MASQRFPKRKYLHALRAMDHELGTWQLAYYHAGEAHPDDWLGSRFEERSSYLQDIRVRISDLIELLDGLPRLS